LARYTLRPIISQNKTIHTPIERGLAAVIRISQLVIAVFTALLFVYATSTYLFISIGDLNLSYPFLSLNDPVFTLLITVIGSFIIAMCFCLILLTLLSNPYDVDATIVILLSFIGIGFAMGAMRAMVPEATEFVLNNIYHL
jgi:hypothetical protein